MKLWLIKDNAVDPDMGWMTVKLQSGEVVNNNRWASSFSKSDGTSVAIDFSKQEIAGTANMPLSLEPREEGELVELGVSGGAPRQFTNLSAGSLRFQRFLYFVNGARVTPDVPIKIAMYCSGLEAMVSSSSTELTHQVAERTAALLYPVGERRLATFQDIKVAYAIRSKAVHGASFKDKEKERVIEASVKIDQICREVALIYLRNADFRNALEADAEPFNDFWWARIFLGSD